MHLGFHIYDVGFQSPNVEAAKTDGLCDDACFLVFVGRDAQFVGHFHSEPNVEEIYRFGGLIFEAST